MDDTDVSKLNEVLNRAHINAQGQRIRVSPIDAKISIRACYDQDYELKTGRRGIDMPDEERIYANSLAKYWMRQYKVCNIRETFNLSYDEWLDRPRAELTDMCNFSLSDEIQELNELGKLNAQFNNKLKL